jgi:hypothetical protein
MVPWRQFGFGAKSQARSSTTPIVLPPQSPYPGALSMPCQDASGWSALHYAAEHGHLALAQDLVSHGADASLASSDGYTALHSAVQV